MMMNITVDYSYLKFVISTLIIALEVVREVVGNVGNFFPRSKSHAGQITNRQKLLAISSLDEGFN